MNPNPSNTPPPLPSNAPAFLSVETAPLLENLLKRPSILLEAWKENRLQSAIVILAVLALIGCGGYGLLAGSFSGGEQWIAAPLKVALGALVSAAICLPSLYIFICLGGGNAKWSVVCGAIAAMLCTTALLLVGFLPVAWIFSQSTTSLAFMGFLYLIIWMVSLLTAMRILGQLGSALGMKGRGNLAVWAIIFVLVTLQMSTALRPILGKSDTVFPTEKKFFIAHWADCMSASAKPAKQYPQGH